MVLVFAGLLLLPPARSMAETSSPPQRVVSLNVCTDELVLRLLPPERIASVSWLARDANTSNVVDLAAHVPINYGLAEEVIPQRPDLVVAGTFTTRLAVALLKRSGARLVEFGIPRSIDDVRAQIREMAVLLHAEERGEEIVGEIDRGLAALPSATGLRHPKALVFAPNGFTTSPGSLADDVIARAGMDNLANDLGLGRYAQVPMEVVLTAGVDVLIVNSERDGPPSLSTETLRHPAFARMRARTRIAVLPSRLWGCPGPGVVDAIKRLRAVGDELRAVAVRP